MNGNGMPKDLGLSNFPRAAPVLSGWQDVADLVNRYLQQRGWWFQVLKVRVAHECAIFATP